MKISYSEKLKSPLWQKKRLQIMSRDKFKCKLCGDEETQLHVHHKEYIDGLEPWDYENVYLITLCEDCHKEVERIKKQEPDILFESIKIYKLGHWTDGSKVIFTSIPSICSMSIFDKNGNWSDGYDFPVSSMKGIIKIFKKSING